MQNYLKCCSKFLLALVVLLFFTTYPEQSTEAYQFRYNIVPKSSNYALTYQIPSRRVRSETVFGFIPRTLIEQRRSNQLHLSNDVVQDEKPSIDDLISTTKSYREEALGLITSTDSLQELEVFRVGFLGKNGKITSLMKEMRNLPKEVKPRLGEVVNIASKDIEEAIVSKKEVLVLKKQIEEQEEQNLGSFATTPTLPYLTTPVGKRHPLSLVMDLACDIFEEIGYEVIDGADDSPEIENDFYNFEALGMPKDHPARNMQDTFYINTTGINTNEILLLRTHTSAVQIREMEKRTPPFKIVVPGRVYRKDDVDATHYPIFHQVELLAIDEIGKLTVSDLLGTVKYFLEKMFGKGIEVKFRSSYFPFTEPSMEVDVYFRGKWLEVLGCGMVDPVVLESVGYDPEKYAGFAAGFGVERFAMIMHNITDIRSFWNNDFEFLEQFPSIRYRPNDTPDEEEILNDVSSIETTDNSDGGWFSL